MVTSFVCAAAGAANKAVSASAGANPIQSFFMHASSRLMDKCGQILPLCGPAARRASGRVRAGSQDRQKRGRPPQPREILMNTMTDTPNLAVTGKHRMTPSEAFVETLVAHGVKDVFG